MFRDRDGDRLRGRVAGGLFGVPGICGGAPSRAPTPFVITSPKSLVLLLALAALWAGSYPLIRLAAPGFGPLPLAYPVYFHLIDTVGPTKTITVTYLIPLFGTLWGLLFLGESVTRGMLAGLVCILVSVALVNEVRWGGRGCRAHRRARVEDAVPAVAMDPASRFVLPRKRLRQTS